MWVGVGRCEYVCAGMRGCLYIVQYTCVYVCVIQTDILYNIYIYTYICKAYSTSVCIAYFTRLISCYASFRVVNLSIPCAV